jgi:hypothetical protein
MRFIQKSRTALMPSVVERCQNLIAGSRDRIYVAAGDQVLTYSAELSLVHRFECPRPLSSIAACASGRTLLLQSGSHLAAALLEKHIVWELDQRTWGDENDLYCVVEDRLWFVSSRPAALCLYNLATERMESSLVLDESWLGGSFALWPVPNGVLLEAPMDCKLAVASRMDPLSLVPVQHAHGYLLGIGADGMTFLTAADSLALHGSATGDVLCEIEIAYPFQAMATFNGANLLFNQRGCQLLADDGLVDVEFVGLGDEIVFRALQVGDAMILVTNAGTMSSWALVTQHISDDSRKIV